MSLGGDSMEPEPEPVLKLISLITQVMPMRNVIDLNPNFLPLITQTISLIRSMDLNSQPESELLSLISQAISLFNSMDLDSQPEPLSQLISLIASRVNASDSGSDSGSDPDFSLPVFGTLILEPEPELITLIHQIFSLVISMDSKWKNLISVCPQLQVKLRKGKFLEIEQELIMSDVDKWECLSVNWDKFRITGEGEATHFYCNRCHGKNHKEHHKEAPLEVKHFLHSKHSLKLVSLSLFRTRECYCCDESLKKLFYCCLHCDFAMKAACVEKPPVLYIDQPKWHEHTLALFPRHASLTCNLCALADLSSPTYMCPPCDFVVHLRCLSLPRLIRISRHLHRIAFTPSFDQGDWFCQICRRKIDNDYGGYTCTKDGCLYVAHSRCATQSNVWDGIELEGEPEETEEEVEPFVRISDGVIQHFSHQHHHLSLDENTDRDYDEDRLCQACTMPIYFGNFYSCMQCDYILHERCANIPWKMHHPIHPHLLTLVTGHVGDIEERCSACRWNCTTGFIYKCSKEGCDFKLHVQCATVSEPLVHESHNIHPLYLTSKPGEDGSCSICAKLKKVLFTNETFNCIECDFSLCFGCATVPQKVRYKHDKHILTLSYGKEKDAMTYWCEVCEKEIQSDEHFYMCDEYCCVTLHKDCLLGLDIYIKPGLSWFSNRRKIKIRDFLYGYGAIFNFLAILGTVVYKGPGSFDILQGHSRATMFLILNNAAQGILSSFFFKYADTILKKYSSTVATIFTGIASAALFGHVITMNFLLGISIVFISMHQFFSPLAKVKDEQQQNGSLELNNAKDTHRANDSFINMAAGANEEATHRGESDDRTPLLPR